MSHLIAAPDKQNPSGQPLTSRPDFKLTHKDILEILHREIQFAQSLIVSRMTWYVTSQSFMMTAFAISGGSGHNFHWLAKGIIPPLGIVISIIIFFSLGAAIEALKQLRARASELMDEQALRDLPFVGTQLDPERATLKDRLTPQAMPILFIIVWVSSLVLVWNFTPDF